MLAHTMMRRLPRQVQQSRFLHTTLVNVYCKPGTADKVVEATVRASPPSRALRSFLVHRSLQSWSSRRARHRRGAHSDLALVPARASMSELSVAVFPARTARAASVLESRHTRRAIYG